MIHTKLYGLYYPSHPRFHFHHFNNGVYPDFKVHFMAVLGL